MKNALGLLRLPDHALLAEVTGWLGLHDAPADETEAKKALRERAVTRFQQLTPPLAAKSVEDTTFYRYAPLLSRNEVGSYPAELAPGVADFHAANARRSADFPRGLLATATHDHKRGEDTRARLAVLSEMPARWAETLRTWMNAHSSARTRLPAPGGGTLMAPSAPDEIMLYQALVGACPADLRADDEAAIQSFIERMAAWQQKALREAKQHSGWLMPDAAYETACRTFLDAVLVGEMRPTFLPALLELVQSIQPAAQANSLTQTLLRLTSPGVPDLYQGCDFEDLSLVDPDNRRPVDMAARRALLHAPDGEHQKQQLIQAALRCRQDHPALFCGGNYVPLEVTGAQAKHVIAFMRQGDGTAAIAVALRLSLTLLAPGLKLAAAWGDTQVAIPASVRQAWRDAVSGKVVTDVDGTLALADLLGSETVALLLADG
jgi:(1->4)-alpha-D-glucan 1-alpha-D-glucosylmutase